MTQSQSVRQTTSSESVKVDLGGGKDPLEDHINVDLRDLSEVDIVAEADDLPFDDGSVDRIHANSLIPHMPDLNKAMEEWSRVLKPGGELELAATHAHSTGIVADPDHYSWSWASDTPGWYDRGSEWAYYSDASLELENVDVVGWLRPHREWLRPASWAFGQVLDRVEPDIADELMKLPFAGGRVIAHYRKPN